MREDQSSPWHIHESTSDMYQYPSYEQIILVKSNKLIGWTNNKKKKKMTWPTCSQIWMNKFSRLSQDLEQHDKIIIFG